MSFFFFFSRSGSTCLFRGPRACCWLLHWTSPSLRTSSHSSCARSLRAPTSPKNCARARPCASLSLPPSLPLSRVSTQRKKRERKKRMIALPTDQMLLLLRSCGTLFLILSLFLSYVFPSSCRCYQCCFFWLYPFPSSWCCCCRFFLLYAFAISRCFCLLYASCYYYCCRCCFRRRRFCCITRFRDLSSAVASILFICLLVIFQRL